MRPVLAAALSQSRKPCLIVILRQRSRSLASDSQRRISVLPAGAPFLAFCARTGIGCDKNDYRGILAGLEGVSGKKAVDSETMTSRTEEMIWAVPATVG